MPRNGWSNSDPRDLVIPPGAGPNDSQIFIGPDIPQVLIDYYQLHYFAPLVKAIIKMQLDANNYHYEVIFTTGGHGRHVEGWVVAGVVHQLTIDIAENVGTEIHYGDQEEVTFGIGSSATGTSLLELANTILQLDTDSVLSFGGGAQLVSDLFIGRVSITPSAPNTPTDSTVNFGRTLSGANFYALVTPNTTLPGTQVTGWSYHNLTSSSIVITLTRTNTTTTGLSFVVIATP